MSNAHIKVPHQIEIDGYKIDLSAGATEGQVLAYDGDLGVFAASDTEDGAVSAVSNTDSTLTISPTTGDVVASLNLDNANTWSAAQTFTGGNDVSIIGAGQFVANNASQIMRLGQKSNAEAVWSLNVNQNNSDAMDVPSDSAWKFAFQTYNNGAGYDAVTIQHTPTGSGSWSGTQIFKIDGYGNTLFVGNVGIGMTPSDFGLSVADITQLNDAVFIEADLDTTGPSGMNIGPSAATSINIAQSGIPTIINGSIGVGISPSFLVDISEGAQQGSYGFVSFRIATSSTETGMQLDNTTADGHSYTILSTGTGSEVGAGSFIIGDGTAGQPRFTINNTGKVGIGTISPAEALHVVGNIQATGHLFVDGYEIDLSAGATNNQVLQYNGTSFVAANAGGGSTGNYTFTDDTIDKSASGQALLGANITGFTSFVSDDTGPADLTIASGANSRFIASNADGTQIWYNVGSITLTSTHASFGGGISILVDGAITTNNYKIDLSGGATTDQVLQYNGTSFVAASISAAIGGSIATHQIAYGASSDILTGSSGLTTDGSNLFVDGYMLFTTNATGLTSASGRGSVYVDDVTGFKATWGSTFIEVGGATINIYSNASGIIDSSGGDLGTTGHPFGSLFVSGTYTNTNTTQQFFVSGDTAPIITASSYFGAGTPSLWFGAESNDNYIYATSSTLTFNSGTYRVSLQSGGYFQANTDLTTYLGAPAARWIGVYSPLISDTTSVTLTAGSTSASLTSSGYFSPAIDNDYGLGQESKRWFIVWTPQIENSVSVTLKSDAGDSGSAVAAIIDTTAAWSTSGSKLLSLRTGGTELAYISASASNETIIHSAQTNGVVINDIYGDQIIANGGIVQIQASAGAVATFFSTQIVPGTDGGISLGNSSGRWANTWSYLYSTVVGSPIMAAATIAPVAGISPLSGTTPITTITPPVSGFAGTLTFLCSAACVFSTGGNINNAITAVSGTPITATYDGSVWWMMKPSTI